MARQADGAVVVRQGDCMILATVVANKDPKPGQSFFPLTVDYQEKFASAGRIPGSFFKREARLNDYEVLTSRLIDRALRPLFPDDYYCDVQVLVSLISADAEVMPDSLACLAASAALAVSDVPIQEVISEVRVARINGQFVVNPNRSQIGEADLNIIVAATEKNIMMVEGEAKECDEASLTKAIEIAHEAIKAQVQLQLDLRAKAGVTTKREYTKPYTAPALEARIAEYGTKRIYDVAKSALGKHERSDAFKQIIEDFKASLTEGELADEDKALIGTYFHDLEKKVIRDMMLDERVRLDGRGLEDVRPLTIEVEPLPSPHGSALFTRGETQSLTTVTLGTVDDELLLETAQTSDYMKFMLHYNFPPFSTGEVKMMRGQSRREVGHGNLAMRSLKQMMPAMADTLMGGLFKQTTGQFAGANAFAASPMAAMMQQWLESTGLQPKPQPQAVTMFDNPFTRAFQEMMGAAQKKPEPQTAPNPFLDNPFTKAFQDMTASYTAQMSGKPAEAVKPAPEAKTPEKEAQESFAAMVNTMFDSGLEVQKSYQKSMEQIFDTYLSASRQGAADPAEPPPEAKG